jgi:hypothetical protein
MNSGSYFINLLSNDFSYPEDYATGQFDNMEMCAFFGVGQPDATPASTKIPTQDRPPWCWKRGEEQKISMLMRTNS